MYFWFNMMGVIMTTVALVAVPIVLIVRDMIRGSVRVWKIAAYAAGYIALQVLTVNLLLSDFPKPSAVDLSVLAQIGDTQIEDFEMREAAFRESPYHMRIYSTHSIYRFNLDGNIVHLTIYRFATPEAAIQNLIAAAGIAPGEVRQITETVHGYQADSVLWRDRNKYLSRDLDREARTYFTVGEILFSLRETGDRHTVGESTNTMIERLLEIFFD